MLNLSHEQSAVVDVVETHNVLVDSVAGSGKTTTAIGICDRYLDKNVLIVTYNSKLRKETRARAAANNVTNVEVHTYHSLCTKYYRLSNTDDGIYKVCKNMERPYENVPKFDILILDEQQDLDNLCFSFIAKFMVDNCNNPRIIIIGDIYQSIYGFKGADERYLAYAIKVFGGFSTDPWVQLKISRSFRMTIPMAGFINTHLLGNNRIKSEKPGEKITYIKTGIFGRNIKEFYQIRILIERGGYAPDDIFVLANSVRKTSNRFNPVVVLENFLVNQGYKCYVPTNDDVELNDAYMKGKIVFSSIHQAKGRERKLVILTGFNNSDYEFQISRENTHDSIIRLYYVALSRASQEMIILQNYKDMHFPTVNINTLTDYCNVYGESGKYKKKDPTNKNTSSVTELVKFLPSEIEQQLISCIETNVEQLDERVVSPKPYEDTTGSKEFTSDLYGNAITLYREMTDLKTQPAIIQKRESVMNKKYEVYGLSYEVLNNSMKELMLACNVINVIDTGYIHRIYQIKDYNWVDDDVIKLSEIILKKYTSDNCSYEVEGSLLAGILGKLKGRADIISADGSLFEVKYTQSTTNEHIIQLALYSYIFNNPNCYLINLRTGEKVTLLKVDIDTIIDILYKHKYVANKLCSDEEFFKKCEQTIASFKSGNLGAEIMLNVPETTIPTVEHQSNADLLERLNKMRNKNTSNIQPKNEQPSQNTNSGTADRTVICGVEPQSNIDLLKRLQLRKK